MSESPRGLLAQGTNATHRVRIGLSPAIEKALAGILGVEVLPEVLPTMTYAQLSALVVWVASSSWLAGEESGHRFPRGEGG